MQEGEKKVKESKKNTRRIESSCSLLLGDDESLIKQYFPNADTSKLPLLLHAGYIDQQSRLIPLEEFLETYSFFSARRILPTPNQ
jgi:hypothetical protein